MTSEPTLKPEYSLIAFLSLKGGVGKTSQAHCLCHGLNFYDGFDGAIFLGTDARTFPNDENRTYSVRAGFRIDPATGESTPFDETGKLIVDKFVARARSQSGVRGLLVIDGAGGNVQADIHYCELVDLVLIPFTPDTEAVDEAMKYALALPQQDKVYFLPNRFERNPKAREADMHYVRMLADKMRAAGITNPESRILQPMDYVHSLQKITERDLQPGDLKSPTHSFSKKLAGVVIDLLMERAAQRKDSTNE